MQGRLTWLLVFLTRDGRGAAPKRADGRPGQARPRGGLQGARLPVQLVPEGFSASLRATSVVMHRYLRTSVFEKNRALRHGWQDRLRDPSLTVLLVLQLFLLFAALPLAATGVPIAERVAWLLVCWR